MKNNNIIGNNLKRIRLLKQLSLRDAGQLLNMSATGISKFEKGELIPDSKKLIQFANAYKVKTIDLLKTYSFPTMKFNSFRKNKNLCGSKLDLLKEMIQIEVAKYLEVLELNNVEKKKIKINKYICNNIEDAELAANKFRKYIEISEIIPVSDLINILENIGIIVILLKNTNNRFNGFDGFSEIVDGYPIIVLLDDIKDGARQRFTIVHELGHLILNCNNSDIDEEKLCNRFSSSLLMPKKAIINEFGEKRGNISFYELLTFKNEYKVSYTATLYRLKDLNVISEPLYRKLNSQLSKNKNELNPILPEQTYQFKKIVHKLKSDNIITISKACDLLGVNEYEYMREDNNY